MAIGRLSIPEGVDLPDPSEMHLAVAHLLVERFTEVQMLPSGVYDVTPEIWTKHTHTHEVTVFDNGQGRYRITPRDESVGYHEFWEGVSSEFHRGGRQVGINERTPLSIIGGGHPNKKTLQLFGFVMYVPEPDR
jgi:hypothetical protein